MKFSALMPGLLAVSMVMAIAACDQKPKRNADENIIRVKGDPRVFVKDTQNRAGGSIREADLDMNSTWTLSIFGFQSLTRQSTNYDKIKAKQDPRQSSAAKPDKAGIAGEGYKFRRNGDGTYTLLADAPNTLALNLKVQDGTLNLVSLVLRGRAEYVGSDFEIIHNSSSIEGDAHSFLVYSGRGGNKTLLSFVFRKTGDRPAVIEKVSRAFYYMFGAGEKIGWRTDRPLEFLVCQPALNSMNKMFENGIAQWNSVLRGRLSVQARATANCPPFSDVNTRTVHIVNDWIEVHGPTTMSPGQTLVEASQYTGKIEDADIFIMLAEWDEWVQYTRSGRKINDQLIETGWFGNSPIRKVLQRTMTHEIGHALGLHHQFDGTPSIMAYGDDSTNLYEYDRQAIQTLYPLNSAFGAN